MKKHELSTDVNEYNFILKKILLLAFILCQPYHTHAATAAAVHNQHLLNKKKIPSFSLALLSFHALVSKPPPHLQPIFLPKKKEKEESINGKMKERKKERTETEKSIAEKIFFPFFPSSDFFFRKKREIESLWCAFCLCVHSEMKG